MPDPVEVVRQFCALMEKRDPEALRPLLANDAVYQNVGMPASTGVEAIVENMGAQFSMFPDAYAFEIVNIASDGPVVLTERLDYIQAPNGTKPAVPVMGTFVIDGRRQDRPLDGLFRRVVDGQAVARRRHQRTGPCRICIVNGPFTVL